ncbi:recombinase family protein [Solemya velesiana gill symbiont]|uniref:recombinase family protein n=1 Tax=Solemya velesiana gill symbiont TaxID=1918948 RepID=UPI0009963C79|nr:recombinase family protein [Solemya velesiana gill symbiont]
MVKKRAFSYIRMSTEAQLRGHSLGRQMELAREYADENNLELVESLQDIGLSAHSGANLEKVS